MSTLRECDASVGGSGFLTKADAMWPGAQVTLRSERATKLIEKHDEYLKKRGDYDIITATLDENWMDDAVDEYLYAGGANRPLRSDRDGPLETRQAMLANGYEPLPLAGKAPMLNSWQSTAINDEAIFAWKHMGPNTGMRAARVPALDVDILDPEGARVARDTLRQLLEGRGKILERVGLHPKFAILLRTDTPFKKITRKFRDKSGTAHKIEVLADGQQIAVAGIHPDTKEPFRWRGGLSPANTHAASCQL